MRVERSAPAPSFALLLCSLRRWGNFLSARHTYVSFNALCAEVFREGREKKPKLKRTPRVRARHRIARRQNSTLDPFTRISRSGFVALHHTTFTLRNSLIKKRRRTPWNTSPWKACETTAAVRTSADTRPARSKIQYPRTRALGPRSLRSGKRLPWRRFLVHILP